MQPELDPDYMLDAQVTIVALFGVQNDTVGARWSYRSWCEKPEPIWSRVKGLTFTRLCTSTIFFCFYCTIVIEQ